MAKIKLVTQAQSELESLQNYINNTNNDTIKQIASFLETNQNNQLSAEQKLFAFDNVNYLPKSLSLLQYHYNRDLENAKEIIAYFLQKYTLQNACFFTATISQPKEIDLQEILKQNDFFDSVLQNISTTMHNSKYKTLDDYEFIWRKEFHKKSGLHLHELIYSYKQKFLIDFIRYLLNSYPNRAEIAIHTSIFELLKQNEKFKKVDDGKYITIEHYNQRYKKGTAIFFTIYDDNKQSKQQQQILEYIQKYTLKESMSDAIMKYKIQQTKKINNIKIRMIGHSQFAKDKEKQAIFYRDHIDTLKKLNISLSDYLNDKYEIKKETKYIVDKTTYAKNYIIVKNKETGQVINIYKAKFDEKKITANETLQYLKALDTEQNTKIKPKLILFAGPAGSGKSTKLIEKIQLLGEKHNVNMITYTARRANSFRYYDFKTVDSFLHSIPLDDVSAHLKLADELFTNPTKNERREILFIDELSLIPINRLKMLQKYIIAKNAITFANADYKQLSKHTIDDLKKLFDVKIIKFNKIYRHMEIKKINDKHIKGTNYNIIIANPTITHYLNEKADTNLYTISKNTRRLCKSTGKLELIANSSRFIKLENSIYYCIDTKQFYNFSYTDELFLLKKNAVTSIRKAQGGEWQKVLYIESANDDQPTRYTAQTRAKQICYNIRGQGLKIELNYQTSGLLKKYNNMQTQKEIWIHSKDNKCINSSIIYSIEEYEKTFFNTA